MMAARRALLPLGACWCALLLLQPAVASPWLFDGLRQAVDSATAGPVVQLRGGQLRGRRMKSRLGSPFLAFQGIPYAKPPLKDLRFRAPKPADPWPGVRDATKEGSWCPQVWPMKLLRVPGNNFGRHPVDYMLSTVNQPTNQFFDFAQRLSGWFPASNDARSNAVSMDEDCLWLNVFTPQTSLPASSLLPVLVNIHGGGFGLGSGSAVLYGPEYLMDRGLVMVSLNYRLGVLGFLHSNTSDAPGNAGLKDQSLALRWVRDNIRAFGGDPDRVTLYGESAGSASAHYHILSPMSRGLFRAAILASTSAQSGVVMPTPKADLLVRLVAGFGGPVNGSPAEMVRYLRAIPALPLAGLVLEFATQEDLRCLLPSLPAHGVVEPRDAGEPPFFTEDPSDLMVAGRYARVPIMLGQTGLEGSLFFTIRSESDTELVEKDPTVMVPDQLYLRLDEAGRRQAAQQLRDLYLGGQRASANTLPGIVDLWGDLALVHGVDLAARWHSLSVPVYRYHFTVNAFNLLTQFLALPQNMQGPGHADDLGYIFYSRYLGDTHNAKQELFEASLDRMLTFVTNFCYHRNPTPNVSEGTPVLWPPFRAGERAYLDIGAELAVRRDLWPERMALWSRLHRQVVGHPVYDPPA